MKAMLRYLLILVTTAILAIAPAQANTGFGPLATISDVAMPEGNSGTTNMVFTVNLSYELGVNTTIAYATTNVTAVAGTDYKTTTGTLTIPAGKTSGQISVPIFGNTTPDVSKTFKLSLSKPDHASLQPGDGSTWAIGTIDNDDGPAISIGDASLVEGTSNCGTTSMVFPVTLSQASTQAVTVSWATADDVNGLHPASSYYNPLCTEGGVDYLIGSGTLTIPAGQTSGQISVAVVGDSEPEFNETFLVNLSAPAYAALGRSQAVGTIIDDDGVGVGIGNASMTEGNSGTRNMVFTVSLNHPAGGAVSVNYATADGSATAGSDYTAKSGTVTVPAGQSTAQISIPIIGDTTPEPDETFYVNLSNPVGATLLSTQGIGTILNDDGVSLTAVNSALTEGNSNVHFMLFPVYLSAASTSDVTFHFATADGTATAGSDYEASSGTATIPAGQTSVTIGIAVKSDTTPEANETFFLNLSNPTNAALTTTQVIGTIGNDDGPQVSISASSAIEGNSGTSMMPFQISLASVAAGDVHVQYSTGDGVPGCCLPDNEAAAHAGVDYVRTYGTATIPKGQLSTTINIPIIGNITPELQKLFTVYLDSDADYAKVGPNVYAFGTILNDDGPKVWLTDSSVAEGNSGETTMVFTATLSEASANDITVFYTTSDGTAHAGTDYLGVDWGGFTFHAGSTIATLNIGVIGNTIPEANKTFYVNLVPNPNYARISRGTAMGTIINDDGPVLSVADTSTLEGNSGTHAMPFTVSLSQPVSTPVTFQYYTFDGTATAPSDYVALPLATATIPAGSTSTTINVTVNGDTTPEPDETMYLSIQNAVGATIVRPQATGTILDDDDPPAISINDQSLAEGNSGTKNMTFTVSLSHIWASPVSFYFATADGTATGGSDYVVRPLTKLTIPAGSLSKTILVQIIGDTIPEENETFFVNLTNPTNGTFAKAQGVGTIIDDDEGDLMSIAQVQGPGDTSPMVGKTVTVTGIVTARASDGFMLQTPDGQQDNDPRTSEGIFISTGTAPAANIAVGTKAMVTGVVQEAYRGVGIRQSTMTEIAATGIRVKASGQALPQPVVLQAQAANTAALDQWERFEGMRVTVPALSVVGPVGGSIDATSGKATIDGRFYGVVKGTPRTFREPGLDAYDPSAPAAGVQTFDHNPERLMIVSRGQLNAPLLAADVGDTVTGLTGVLGYGDGVYQLWPDPTSGSKVIAGSTSQAVPMGGTYTIGQFNLGSLVDSSANYTQRLAKTANAICAYTRSPAILGVQQVDSAKVLADLATAVNGHAGNALFPKACADATAYRAVGVGSVGPDGALGFLVNTADVWPGKPRVQVQSTATLAQQAVFHQADGSSTPLFAASPMLLQARLNAKRGDALDLTVLQANLQALEGLDEDAKGTHGWRTLGEQVRAQRQAQAQWLATWLQARQVAMPNEKLVVLGGFNANQFDDGHADLLGQISGQPGTSQHVLGATNSPVRPALANLTWTEPAASRYDSIWQGNAESSSHILVNRTLLDAKYKLRVDHARLNADFGLDNYDDYQVPLRTSAQDPAVLSIDGP